MTKAESARINGARSRGPATPKGRAASSGNATRHGLTAKTLILQNENPDDFLEMLSSYFDLLQPANQMEVDIVSDIVAARWRLRRMWRYQTAILDVEMDTQAEEFEERFEEFDEDARGAVAFAAQADKSKAMITGAAELPPLCDAKFGGAVLSRLHDDFDIVPWRYQETHEALDRISSELAGQHS